MEDAAFRAAEQALQTVVERAAFSGPDTPAFRQRLVRDAKASLDRLRQQGRIPGFIVRIADEPPLTIEAWLQTPQRVQRVIVTVDAM